VTYRRVVRLLAPAKVNLFLRVHGRREDGFHEIETLFQAIGLADVLEVSIEPGRVDGADLALHVSGADLGSPDRNLAWRAARAFLTETGADVRVRVALEKRIPAGAGLGGGSSDAAAVLRALDALLPGLLSPSSLLRLGGELGSDVTFFLGASPLAMAKGRGELLEPLQPLPTRDVVVVMPPVHVSTAWAYRVLDEMRTGGTFARPGAVPIPRPDSWALVAAVAANDFEDVVPADRAEVAASLEALRSAGASVALLSGSGGACFGIFPDAATSDRVARTLRGRLGWPALATRTLERFGEARPVETA